MASGNDVEVEADRKAAEVSGCAVTLKSNQHSHSDHREMPSEAPKPAEEDAATRRRGRGQGWGRGRPRASRFRPLGHCGQGSQHENHATESDLLEDNNSDKRLSPSYAGYDATSDKRAPSGDWDTGPPSESSALHLHESQSLPSNGGQKPRESSRGQRAMSGRGHSRGPFAKFVTVPDASHSHDVRHVEEVNNSIVINIDRSSRSGGDSMKRGGGRGTGGGGGYCARSNSTGEMLEDGAGAYFGDQETGVLHSSDNAPHQKSGYRGQGRRPFRGRGDGSFRGRGEGFFRGQGQRRADGFRRGRGDGPRPFRGGYRADQARGGRNSRRAVIVTSKSEGGDSSRQIPDPEEWDKIVPAADIAGEAGASDGHCWTSAEDGSAKWEESEGNNDPNRSEAWAPSPEEIEHPPVEQSECHSGGASDQPKRNLASSGHSCEELHKELGVHESEEVAHHDQPEEIEHPPVEQSECNSGGASDQPKPNLASRDESVSIQAEHSPSITKPSESMSDFQVEVTVEKLKEKASSNAETDLEPKPHQIDAVSKAAEVENPSSHNNDSHDLVPEKAASGESKDDVKLPDLEVKGAVDLSSSKNDSHDLVPENAVGGDSKRSDLEMSSSKLLPPEAAAVESTLTSFQSGAPANVPVEESNSSEPSKPADNGLVEKSEAVSSEIPASVKEKT